jgi:Ca2+-binding RTX toxin-like protein
MLGRMDASCWEEQWGASDTWVGGEGDGTLDWVEDAYIVQDTFGDGTPKCHRGEAFRDIAMDVRDTAEGRSVASSPLPRHLVAAKSQLLKLHSHPL